MNSYVIIGASGFVAPRHMQAIKDVGGKLIACLDPHDSVGVVDSYFPDCKYFREFEVFDRFCSKGQIDYVSICSPNFLHDAHCRFALRIGADAICEKPLVLNMRNIEGLQEMELQSEFHNKIWVILQLRLNPKIQQLKEQVWDKSGRASIVYQTPRGNWYPYSWKGNVAKSGGLATNVGVHLFDILLYLFGPSYTIIRWVNGERKCYGEFKMGNFEVIVELSIEKHLAPKRLLMVNGVGYELSGGFKDAHTKSYQRINEGMGFTIEDALPAIQICEDIRHHK